MDKITPIEPSDNVPNIDDENGKTFNDRKQELEIIKIQKEIDILDRNYAELTKPWFQKPQWIGILIPVIVASATLFVAHSTGFLQAQSTLNKIQEENFKKGKDSIIQLMGSYKHVNDSLKSVGNNLIKQLDHFKSLADTLFGDDIEPNSERYNAILKEYKKVKSHFLMCDSLEETLIGNALRMQAYVTQLEFDSLTLDSSLLKFHKFPKLRK